jgi:hypothetical protein
VAPHSPEVLGKLSEAYRRLAGRRGWTFVDLYPVLEAPGDFADVAHPTAAANRKIAEAVGRGLAKVLPPDG